MSRHVLSIDPGSERSGWVIQVRTSAGWEVRSHGLDDNARVLAGLRSHRFDPYYTPDLVVIEWTAPRGMLASAQLFETLWWAGRFAEAWHPGRVERLARLEVKKHLCGAANAKDSNVHQALIDRFGGIGGKAAAVGTKASPGPLHGIVRDIWAALAVGVTWIDQQEGKAA